MKRLITLILSMTLILCACGQKVANAPTWQEQYDLGVRYLSEGNYQEAIIAFTTAIEIDPKQAEAYISLADAYISAGDYEKAESIILKGREACGDLEHFDRLSDNLSFLQSGEDGIRITDFYFDKEAYLDGAETEFLVSVAYRCPKNEECILMIGANTVEPYSFRMLDEDFAVTGNGGYQFYVSVIPCQWEETFFGIYVNLSEADHAETWTPFDSDTLYIDPDGNVVNDAPYVEDGADSYGSSLLAKGITDSMVTADEVLFFNNPIMGLDINTMEGILHANGYEITTNAELDGTDDDYWWIQGELNGSAHISALQYKNEDVVSLWGYDDYGDYQDNLPIGIRDIYTDDSLSTVLTKLGFSNGEEVSAMICNLANQEFGTIDDVDAAIRPQLDVDAEDFYSQLTQIQTTILGNGNQTLCGFVMSLHFEELPDYSITFEFGGVSSKEFVPTLSGYAVYYFG